MTDNGHTIATHLETPIANAIELMEKHDLGFLPVVDAINPEKLVGVITDRDIVIRGLGFGLNLSGLRVQDLATKENLITVKNDADICDAVDIMTANQIRRLPVVNNKEQFIGVVTVADLVGHMDPAEFAELYEIVVTPKEKHNPIDYM